MAESVSPKHLDARLANIAIGKIRALDVFMADNKAEQFGSDYDYVASMKDWVDKKKLKRKISFRQEWRLNQIWNHITERIDLNYEDFMDEGDINEWHDS